MLRVALIVTALAFARVSVAEETGPAIDPTTGVVNGPADSYETVVEAGPQWNVLEPVGAVPESVKIVERQTIERSGAATVQELLHQIAGVPQADEQGAFGQMDIALRGLVASPVTGLSQGVSVFVDGVRVNEPAVEEVNFDLLPLADVERIEIVRGPGRLSGRNTLGAAINIVTRRAAADEAGASVAFGSFLEQRYRVWAGGRRGPVDAYVSLNHLAQKGYRDQSQARASYLFTKLGYQSGATDVTLSQQLQLDRIEEAGSLPESALAVNRRTNYSGGDYYQPKLSQTVLTARRRLYPELALVATGHLRVLDVEQFNVNRLDEDSRLLADTNSAGVVVQLFHRATGRWLGTRTQGGAEVTRSHVEVRVLNAERDPAAVGADPFGAVRSRVADDQVALGASVQERLSLNQEALHGAGTLHLAIGARIDDVRHRIVDSSPDDPGHASGDAEFIRLTPATAVTFETPRLSLSASYAHGFRAPAFLELTCSDPDSPCVGLQAGVAPDTGFGNLRPVRAHNYELGATVRALPWTELRLAAFRMDLVDDILSVAPANTVQIYFQNVGTTRRQGLEAELSVHAEPVALELAYSFTRATFESDLSLPSPRTPGVLESVAAGSEIPLVPRHRANASVIWQALAWLSLRAEGVFTGAQRLRGDEANTQPGLSSYTTVNLSVMGAFRGCSAFLRASNLTNRRYETFGTFAPNALAPGQPIERFLTPGLPFGLLGGVGCQITR